MQHQLPTTRKPTMWWWWAGWMCSAHVRGWRHGWECGGAVVRRRTGSLFPAAGTVVHGLSQIKAKRFSSFLKPLRAWVQVSAVTAACGHKITCGRSACLLFCSLVQMCWQSGDTCERNFFFFFLNSAQSCGKALCTWTNFDLKLALLVFFVWRF